MSQSIALITGASSGLGQEYVRQLSRDPKVQEIWAIARRKDRLEALSTLAACPVRAIPLDLTRQESLDTLRDLLAQEQPRGHPPGVRGGVWARWATSPPWTPGTTWP